MAAKWAVILTGVAAVLAVAASVVAETPPDDAAATASDAAGEAWPAAALPPAPAGSEDASEQRPAEEGAVGPPVQPLTWDERQAAMAGWVDPPRPDPASLTAPLDAEAYRRPDGTLPFWTDNLDLAYFSAVTAELAISSPAGDADTPRVNAELRLLELAMPLSRDYRDHDQLVSAWMTLATWETLDLLGGRGARSATHLLAVGVRLDAPWWGAGLGAHVMTLREPEVLRFLLPEARLRLGPVDGPKLTASARFSGAFAFGTGEAERAFDRNVDVRAQAEWPLDDVFRPQVRARYRDFADDEHAPYNRMHQRDVYAAAGVEVGLPLLGRGLPTFVGLGVRHVLASAEGYVADGEAGARTMEPVGTQVLVVLRSELGFHFSDSGLW